MQLELLFTQVNSSSSCPSVYLGDTGEFVVQGPAVDESTAANLVGVDPGEVAVRIPAEVLLGAVLRYTDRGARPHSGE